VEMHLKGIVNPFFIIIYSPSSLLKINQKSKKKKKNIHCKKPFAEWKSFIDYFIDYLELYRSQNNLFLSGHFKAA